jgi:hypothetical protein
MPYETVEDSSGGVNRTAMVGKAIKGLMRHAQGRTSWQKLDAAAKPT